jgi:hypothetical protein
MVTKIVDLTCKRDQEDLDLIGDSDLDRDMLETIVLEKLESYRRAFKQVQPRFDEDEGRMETAKEAQDRAADTIEQTHLDARSNSSKHRVSMPFLFRVDHSELFNRNLTPASRPSR